MEYKIGLLLPQSSDYATSKDFVWGMRRGLQEAEGFKVGLEIENIGHGSKAVIRQQYDRLALQHQPNLMVGICQWRSLVENEQLFNQHRIPTIFCNLGANIPQPELIHEDVYFNSFNLWQSVFGLGKYLGNQGHKKVLYLSHYYDGGYHTPYAFCGGLEAAGAGYSLPFSIQDGYTAEEFNKLKQHIAQNKPSALFTIYSNPRHYILLEWLKKNVKDLPVYASPHWISDFLLAGHPNKAAIGVSSATAWSRLMNNEVSQQVTSTYEDEEELTTSVFVMLGYETGSLIAQAYQALGDKWHKRKSLKSFLLEAKLKGPRDGFHFDKDLQYSSSNHHLRQIQATANGLENIVLQPLDIEGASNIVKPLYENQHSGWDNPYLCV